MSERWLPVVGYEGAYQVSDLGRVRSLDRMIVDSVGHRYFRAGRILRQVTLKGTGHCRVTLPGGIQGYVHRLVLEAFVGPAPDGMEACHNDGDPTNNRLDNLRWDTRSANNTDAVRHQRNLNARKTHCPAGHPYDEANTRVIRSRPNARYCIACNDARHAAAKSADADG